jgi:16S rRNA (guanine527-N7)-methyltransferase
MYPQKDMLSPTRIAELLHPYLELRTDNGELTTALSTYLDLLLRWNARTNLTAIREPEEIVTRHFGESLFAAAALDPYLPPASILLDFGSGAGFPGLPIQLFRPDIRVTLAESQNKKSTFLREVIRTLAIQLPALPTEVWPSRVESMPTTHLFHCITLRAVDRMDTAIAAALPRLAPTGILALLTGETPANLSNLTEIATLPIPQSTRTHLRLYRNPA